MNAFESNTEPNPSGHWAAVKALFDSAMALEPALRVNHVHALAPNATVAQEVRNLLAHATDTGASAFLSGPAQAQTAVRVGQVLGAWRLVSELGAGGMGEVYLAERCDGNFTGQAAIKVLKRGMDSAKILARFDLERQSLARLDHPNIARLLDAGLTPDGLPYFVMEYVRGVAADVACLSRSLEDKLALFLQTAAAVTHAHRNLLVHRDVKPSNVLVTELDVVKLLDFGIAKAIDPQSEDADRTRDDERPYTPSFASPEQVRGEPVTTSTDVYSLGVLLYVMLTGVRPYARDTNAAHETARAVVESLPTLPSSLDAKWVTSANWSRDSRLLRGDLDTILMKALAKSIGDRYASVDDFASDIRAYLGGYPIAARPNPWTYVARRFVTRNKLGVGLGVAAMASLLLGSAALAWQAKQTDLARAKAEARFADVRKLVSQMVFKYHDEIAELAGASKAREQLLSDALSYVDTLYQDAKSDPGLAREVAAVYLRLGVLQGERFSPSQEKTSEAARNIDRAIALLPLFADSKLASAEDLASAAEIWRLKSDLLKFQAKLLGSMEALKHASAYAEKLTILQPNDAASIARQATLLGRLGAITGASLTVPNLGRIGDALQHIQNARDLFAKASALKPDDAEYIHQWAWGEHQLAGILASNGSVADAIKHAKDAVSLRDRALAMRSDSVHMKHQTATARANLAGILAMAGQRAEAIAAIDQAQVIFSQILSKDPGSVIGKRDLTFGEYSRARILGVTGICSSALPLLRATEPKVAELSRRSKDAYLTAWHSDNLTWLSRCLSATGAHEAALTHATQSLALLGGEMVETEDAARAWGRAQALGAQALALRALGRRSESVQVARDSLKQWQAVPGASDAPATIRKWHIQSTELANATLDNQSTK